MPELLAVDPTELLDAGAKLADVVLPPAPAPVTATGTDALSAAINETMQVIESPVVNGLLAANAALRKTGSNIADAAELYATTDQALSKKFTPEQLEVAGAESVAGAAGDDTGTNPPAPDQLTQLLSQLAPMAGSVVQSVVQAVQGAIGSIPTGGAEPAQVAADNAVA